MNIGYRLASSCFESFVFHDVDLLPASPVDYLSCHLSNDAGKSDGSKGRVTFLNSVVKISEKSSPPAKILPLSSPGDRAFTSFASFQHNKLLDAQLVQASNGSSSGGGGASFGKAREALVKACKDTDFCRRAVICIERDLFSTVNGFSERLFSPSQARERDREGRVANEDFILRLWTKGVRFDVASKDSGTFWLAPQAGSTSFAPSLSETANLNRSETEDEWLSRGAGLVQPKPANHSRFYFPSSPSTAPNEAANEDRAKKASNDDHGGGGKDGDEDLRNALDDQTRNVVAIRRESERVVWVLASLCLTNSQPNLCDPAVDSNNNNDEGTVFGPEIDPRRVPFDSWFLIESSSQAKRDRQRMQRRQQQRRRQQ